MLRGYCRAEAFLIRRNRRWTVHLLSLALFCAQLGVVLHASTHLRAESTHPAQLCSQCLSSASLQNMVGDGASIVAKAHVERAVSLDCDALPSAPLREFSAFRSRAPPALS